jgi:hypothetical protein
LPKIPWEEMAQDTCFHEAAHAVFVHHHKDFELRYVEVDVKGDGTRQNITWYSGHPLVPDLHAAKDLAVMYLAGEYAVYRGRFGDERRGYEPFEEFMEQADPEHRFRDLGGYDNLGRLLTEYANYHRGEGEWREYREEYGGDGMDALVNLRVVASHASLFVEGMPSPEQVPGGENMLRWRDLRNCYEDASREAFRFLAERWAEIDAIAKRLMQTGHLDSSEVARTVEAIREVDEGA